MLPEKSSNPFYPNLEAEIAKRGIKKKDLACKLNLTPKALSNKLIGKTDFWLSEVMVIHSIFPDIEPVKLFEHQKGR